MGDMNEKHDEYCGCLQCMTSSTLGKMFFQLNKVVKSERKGNAPKRK